ncbi:alpha-L-rhamnosidase [Pedobacter westerhofensis]|uniref:Alpha-L-rhamnosidase n=1 Tax=Pedobacter westerhofensis TaxID=425512 RepID=A0A521B883_9SPHI|nr:glycosyl hydrolase [Pedobacter westerhofensis]SMO43297.1 alpha-L-rhamnosidase [Pedobacter westerhofensis]
MRLYSNQIKLCILAGLTSWSLNSSAQLIWPEITNTAKPWTRWWWQGSAVDKENLKWNMELYRDAGLGGMEITPIYGVKGAESRFIPFLSPQWISLLQYTLAEAKRLHLGIDMANASGWPFGGPWVPEEDAAKSLFWKSYEIRGGEKLNEPVRYTQKALFRAQGQAPKPGEIKQPIQANKNLQLWALDQVRFDKDLSPVLLMAYNEKHEAIDLTKKLSTTGQLNWVAPAGSGWQLYALFQGDQGKMVERAAPGGEGMVIDHFSKPVLLKYLNKFDEVFTGGKGDGIRAFFNDSYEVDDAKGQADFTPEFFAEFNQRRGYDLRNHLPELLDNANSEVHNRVVFDYRETIADLLLDNFTQPWHEWGKSRHALIRNQSHGSPANILDLYAAVDIPETEGTDLLTLKFASSAAHVSGKALTSSESATWLGEHFSSSLADVKSAIDNFFIGGVNHVFYHGTTYSPKDAAWPGWLFYASVQFNPTNPLWHHFSALNRYIARCQSFLQQGRPGSDVLLYYPLHDSFSAPGNAMLKHYNTMKEFAEPGFEKVSGEMLDKGFSFDYISDKQIAALQSAGHQLRTGGIDYQTLLIPDCKMMSLPTLRKIIELARSGATVIIYKDLPADVPGFGDLAGRQQEFAALLGSLDFKVLDGMKVANPGKGKIILADELSALLAAANVRRESLTDQGLQFVRRKGAAGSTYFIVNPTKKEFRGWITLAADAASVALFDPMRETAGLATSRKLPDGGTEVYLQLQPGESCILQSSSKNRNDHQAFYFEPSGAPLALGNNWTIRFLEGGPTLPQPIVTDRPGLWTDLGSDDARVFSGLASYATSFARPSGNAAIWKLDLAKVYESAEVYLNGKKLATLLGPDYSVNIPAALLKINNKLEIRIANLMANRIIDMEHKGIPYKIFYNTNLPARYKENRGEDGLFTAIKWAPRPSGMKGTVTLRPMKVTRVN